VASLIDDRPLGIRSLEGVHHRSSTRDATVIAIQAVYAYSIKMNNDD